MSLSNYRVLKLHQTHSKCQYVCLRVCACAHTCIRRLIRVMKLDFKYEIKTKSNTLNHMFNVMHVLPTGTRIKFSKSKVFLWIQMKSRSMFTEQHKALTFSHQFPEIYSNILMQSHWIY